VSAEQLAPLRGGQFSHVYAFQRNGQDGVLRLPPSDGEIDERSTCTRTMTPAPRRAGWARSWRAAEPGLKTASRLSAWIGRISWKKPDDVIARN